MRRKFWTRICVLILFTCILILSLKKSSVYKTKSLTRTRTRLGTNKLILFWTEGWSGRKYPIVGWNVGKNTLEYCPIKCDFTSDQKLLKDADALIYLAVSWNVWRYYKEKLFNPLPPRDQTNWDQVWTFLRVEAPTMTYPRDFYEFDNVFNWTATYRLDSDVHYPYGMIKRKTTLLSKKRAQFDIPTVESVRNRRMIGWMSSHTPCTTQSNRDALAAELRKYVPIDTYGKCGELGSLGPPICDYYECYGYLGTRYKFWLVFENSLCVDYLSEKFFRALEVGMVPIVYAHPSFTSYLDMLGLPKGSYVNVWDFENMADLGSYLLHLHQSTEDYLKYLEWRKEFRSTDETDNKFWCDYCTKLNEYLEDVENGGKRKSYPSMHDWWHKDKKTGGPACIEPRKVNL